MKFFLTHNIKESIKNECLKNINEELCGLILLKEGVYSVFSAANLSNSAQKHFVINPEDYLKAEELGKIIGVYHSHISDNNFLSEYDILNAKNQKLIYICHNVKNDVFDVYNPLLEGEKSKYSVYIGLTFEIGRNDCYSLVKNYLKSECYIDLIETQELIGRNKNWYKQNPNLFFDIFKLNKEIIDLIDYTGQELVGGDILMFDFLNNSCSSCDCDKAPHHLGVYLGRDMLLHHPVNKNSTVDFLNSKYLQSISKVVKVKINE